MPYRSATGSGVLGLAYRYGVPVIASALPGIAEHVRDGETGWLVEPGSVDGLARTLERVSADRARSMKPAIEAFAQTLTWEALAASLIEQMAGARAERR
jgi:glycosyltransferase involved in cell wall biosynthesis